jgi:hypothetical protein
LKPRHLLVDLRVCVIVSSCEDERDRLGREIAAADQPLVSLKDVEVSSGFVLGGGHLRWFAGSGLLRSLSALLGGM